MTPQDLQLFSRQIALWTESAIALGRSPFRKVETFPPLLTAAGEKRPPVVVWINRDSLMAGGVLTLPNKEAAEALEEGRHCALALGLRHFATWAPRELVLWETSAEGTRPYTTLSLPEKQDPETFRTALRDLLEHFKLLSVSGALPAERLSPHYFANLCRMALEGAFASLTEAARIAQSEGRMEPSTAPLQFAWNKGVTTLLRLLGLLAYDRLPPGIQPEKLERAMAFALDDVPPPLDTLLSPVADELPLPGEAAIRFHHLFRRLSQLRFGNDRLRAADVLEILLRHEAARLGGHPPPPAGEPAPQALLLHWDRPAPPALAVAAEVAPLPLLCLGALLRELRGMPHPALLTPNSFALTREAIPPLILGTLQDRSLPGTSERLEMTGHLRRSWPNRRFSLPPRTPQWAWECLHLLGLAPQETRIELHLPSGWLTADFALPLVTVLREHYTLTAVRHAETRMHLSAIRQLQEEGTVLLGDAEGEHTIEWAQLRDTPLPLCCLVLAFPSVFLPLTAAGVLQPADACAWQKHRMEILRFGRTSLGEWLLSFSPSPDSPLPADATSETEAEILIPGPDVLDRLRFVQARPGETERSALDRELALLLDLPADFPARLSSQPSACAPARKAPSPRNLAETIAATVFADGIPRFPEQYLYDYYRPPLESFAVTGALQVEENFFGRITLRDGAGARITVDGAERARALELASYSGRSPIQLPRDQQIIAEILDRYLHDLRHLKQALLRQTHLRAVDARAADALAQRIWKSLPLPPWSLVEP